MAVQQNKVSKSRRNQRRAHDWIRGIHFIECPNCGEPKRPHHVCGACGYYNGFEVVSSDDGYEVDED